MATTYNTGLKKAEKFCAYQERCQQEVREKLYALDMYPSDVERVITELILTNFLNEERFARAYARGRFKIKQWGRNKIKAGLKMKRISNALVNVALAEIDDEEYLATAKALIEKKFGKGSGKTDWRERGAITRYLLQKGYENEVVKEALAGRGDGDVFS